MIFDELEFFWCQLDLAAFQRVLIGVCRGAVDGSHKLNR